ncbi:MAG: hypothetical protein KDD47_02025, partial [Acidobacteria bacterium]|nr:hypothetical protein [Acidobacteriota bacterium]
LAELDVDGTGTAASAAVLAALGVSDGERRRLAGLYGAGTSLWRSPIPHLTPWDCNWPYTAPDDAVFPPDDLEDPFDPDTPQDPDEAGDPEDPDAPNDPEDEDADRPDKDEEPCRLDGSVLEVEDQVLGEALGITGSELSLHYRSDRQRGRTAEYRLRTRVTGSSPPASLKRVELQITIAGQSIRRTFTPAANQAFSFTWDGEDAYSRDLQGRYSVTIQKGYVYDGQLRLGGPENPNWGQRPSGAGGEVRPTREGAEIVLTRTRSGSVDSLAADALGTFDARELGLGGWTLSAHHVYDPDSRTLYLGDGSQRRARHLGPVLTAIAGDGEFAYGGDGGPAVHAQFAGPSDVAVAPDGSVYVADANNHRIRKVAPDGVVTTIAGTGEACVDDGGGGGGQCGPLGCGVTARPGSGPESVAAAMGDGVCGDGGLATDALLSFPRGVAVAPDGSVLVADTEVHCVRRISASGVIEAVAGLCQPVAEPAPLAPPAGLNFPDDGGPATDATLSLPWDLAVAPDGGFYIADRGNRRVAYVGPNGLLTTVAGGGSLPAEDGAEALEVDLEAPTGVSLGPNGDLFLVENQGHRVWRLGVDGRLYRVAGTGDFGFAGDGGPAVAGELAGPERVLAAEDGSVYVSDSGNGRVRKVDPAGILGTVAGTGTGGPFVSGAPATGNPLGFLMGLALDPEGNLLLADVNLSQVLKMGSALEGFGEGELVVPASGGSALYVFDAQGRHLRTQHALTGTNLYRFEYGADGLLGAVVDRNEQRTTIERDAQGRAEGITAPSGQQTALVLDPEGYLETWTDPAGNSQEFLYRLGLLELHRDPRGNASTYQHGIFGRLAEATDRAGGIQTFARFGSPFNPNAGVTALDGVGVSVFYKSFEFRDGTRGQTVNDDSLRIHRARQEPSGLRTTERADGSRSSVQEVTDPRFGMAASRTGGFTATLPGGATMSATTSTQVIQSDPDDPLSLTGLTESVTVNGRTFTSSYDGATRTVTSTSPLGRTSSAVLDPLGQLVEQRRSGLVPIRYEVRPDGLLSAVRVGDGPEQRSTVLSYDGQRRLASVTDPLGRSSSFTYDAANRLTSQTLPDGSAVRFTYDASGNLTSLTPPGRGAHAFGFTPLDQVAAYQPAGGDPASAYGVSYTASRELSSLTRPGGEVVTFGYDSLGRLETLTHGRGVTTFSWDATAGQVGAITTPEGETLAYSFQGPVRTGTTWSGPVVGSVSRTLTNDLKVGSIAVNGLQLASYSYDADGLLIQAGPVTLSRDPGNGRITGTSLGPVSTVRSFNGFGELTGLAASHGTTPLFAATYQRDALGRVTEAAETVLGSSHTTAYRYDLRGRLVEVERDGVLVEAYTYDANGNRTSIASPSELVTAAYDAEDRLTAYGDLTYAYTPAGELASKSQGGAEVLYRYDAFGNLLSVTQPDGVEIEYVVDGENRRVGKRIAGALVQGFLYGGALSPVAELDGSGAVVSRFVYGSRGNVPDVLLKNGQTYRILADPLGSVRLVVDTATGDVVQELAYDAFGQVQLDTNPGFQPFGFGGGLYDAQTGLLRFGVRDYDPQVGRWTSKDPLGFAAGDTNLYAYVFNDPVNGVDPSGQILPALALGWAAFEAGMAIYDVYNAWDTLTDPCADLWDQGLAVGGVLAGAALPGGGYGAGAQFARKAGGRADDLVDLFRAVSPEEFYDIQNLQRFRTAPNSLNAKQFGLSLDEVLALSDYLPDAAAIVRVRVPRRVLDALDRTPVDASILRSGSVTAHAGSQLDLLNDSIVGFIEHVF